MNSENKSGAQINLGFVAQQDDSEKEQPLPKEEEEEEDPWTLPNINVKDKPPFSELTVRGKCWRVWWDWIMRYVVLILTLYLFICSIGFLGSAFQLLGGKAVGNVFRQSSLLSNPIAGLMIGVLATVLVQSSSTTTSIIVTMVAADILTIKHAVYIVMGANIGTSVTNTIVALGQISNKQEFRRAFAGATVHDMFNWLSVIIFLPIEAATGYLQILSKLIVESTGLQQQDTKRDILKVITKPFTKLIISIDKSKIYGMTKDVNLKFDTIIKICCKKNATIETTVLTHLNVTECNAFTNISNVTCFKNVTQKSGGECLEKCRFMFQNVAGVWSDVIIGAILLAIALILMIICLVIIVKLLQSILQGHIARVIHKFLNSDLPGVLAFLTGYLAILLGAGLTILVQSSSIFTSSITPLVGVGVISIYRMYPLTLGANIGTTFTSVLAALSVDSEKMPKALTISMCHLFFNISGILVWYPIPFMRKVPITLAKKLGDTTAKYRWFALLYLFVVFFLLPAAIFGLSMAGWYVLAAVMGPVVILLVVVIVVNVLQVKAPSCLHHKLRTWDWLPLWMHSLRPLNNLFINYLFCCKKHLAVAKTVEPTTVTCNTHL